MINHLFSVRTSPKDEDGLTSVVYDSETKQWLADGCEEGYASLEELVETLAAELPERERQDALFNVVLTADMVGAKVPIYKSEAQASS